jgi:hypothetical protein
MGWVPMKNRTHKAWQQPIASFEDGEIYYIECGHAGKKLRLAFDHIDPGREDWRKAFEVILTFLGYHPDTIRDMFNNEDMIQKHCLEDVVCLSGHGDGCSGNKSD